MSGPQLETESVKRCYECKQAGHMARDCPKRQPGWKADGGVQKARGEVKCFSCGQKGHIAMRCPAKALFCGRQRQAREPLARGVGSCSGMEMCRTGLVEGTRVTISFLILGAPGPLCGGT